MALEGVNGYLVEIQIDVSGGLPSFDMVGLPDIRVKEAKERVRAAIKNSGVDFPSRKIIINLAPADKRKEGTFFDLPIAVGILNAMQVIHQKNLKNFESTIFLGELSLDGRITGIHGVLPMCMEAIQLGIMRVVLPKENAVEASVLQEIEVIAVENLREVIGYVNGELKIAPTLSTEAIYFTQKAEYSMDFSEVKGQETIKRALEIAAAGSHNCLLIRKSRFWKDNAFRKTCDHFARFKFGRSFRNNKNS